MRAAIRAGVTSWVLAGALALLAVPSAASTQDAVPLLVVLDASGSMLEPDADGERRIAAAKTAVLTVVRELPDGTPLGLRVFGSSAAQRADRSSCSDSRLLLPVAALDRAEVSRAVRSVRARGWTPIGYALRRAAEDLRRSAEGVGTVVLVSDGVDECYPRYGPEPCEVARALAGGEIRLTVHTVGLAVDRRARKQLGCIAEATGGRYSDADDADSLASALRVGLLPAPEPPPAPPEPQRPDLVVPAVAVLLAGTAAAGVIALVRSARTRRARSYW